MIHIECPWCAGTATVEVADGGEIRCVDCGVHVELAPDAIAEPIGKAA